MIGVDYNILNKIIQVNDLNLGSINKDTNRLIESINSIESCYQGESIKGIFSCVTTQKESLKEVPQIVANYSSILHSVGESHIKQDEKVGEYLDYVNSQVGKKIR